MKNFLNALHEIGGNILVSKYIRNVTSMRSSNDFIKGYGKLRHHEFLNVSFMWPSSPERHTYWSSIYSTLSERDSRLEVDKEEAYGILEYYKQNPQLKEISN